MGEKLRLGLIVFLYDSFPDLINMLMDKKIRLALLGSNGLPAHYGGTETFYENLTRQLSGRYDITVYCSKNNPKVEGNTYLGAKLLPFPLKANGMQGIIYDMITYLHAAKRNDVLLIFVANGAPVIPFIRLFHPKVKIVINDGGLDEWKRESYGSFGRAWIKWCFKISRNCIHVADNNLYVNSLKNTFGIDAHMIRYGGDNVSIVKPNEQLLAKYPFLKDDYYVSVSRAQVDNNLHIVLEAFAMMPEKTLVLVSNFGKTEYGKNLYDKYKDYKNIYLINGVYQRNEIDAIRYNARVYVHSHSRCGTPPSLCEAMYLGRPIISFDADVNHEVTEEHALFFRNAYELKMIVERLTVKELDVLSNYSEETSHREYTWATIANKYAEIFDGSK